MSSNACVYVSNIWLVLGILTGLFSGCSTTEEKADLVIHNAGNIYTMNEKQPTVEAVAVAKGTIVFVGSNQAIQSWIGKQTRVLDLQGQTMTPGFIESHAHLLSLGYSKMHLDLSKVKNYQELIDQVAAAAQEVKPGEWILGRGWHQSKWNPSPKPMVRGFQTHQALSKVSPDNPVYLTHASGHAGLANAKAMALAGVSASTQFSGDGEILKDASGNPSGIFNEAAQKLITRHIPGQTAESHRKALDLAMQECLKNGITSFQDAGSNQDAIDIYREFLDQKKLKIRLWVMLRGDDEKLLQKWYAGGRWIGTGENFLTVRAIKLVADGALGSRGAWLLAPYADRANHTGHATLPVEYIYKVAQEALHYGFQVCAHAIGDRANREVLDQFEKAFQEVNGENETEAVGKHRFRIEHAQHVSLQDIPRFKNLGIIASMQGIHMASDRPWAIDRLGKQRIVEGAYVWQKFLQAGVKVINGTDAPVEPINPIACFYASTTRKTLEGQPADGYEADQKMTREQALRSYTLDAAYGAFEEDIKGSIEVGKLADFTVFSQDIMKITDQQLLETKVLYTIINGKIVYQKISETSTRSNL